MGPTAGAVISPKTYKRHHAMHPLSHSSCSQCSTLAPHLPHPDSGPARSLDSKRQFRCSKALWTMTAVALTCVQSGVSAESKGLLCQCAGPTAPISATRLYALPMQFESNVGQTCDSVRFLARGPGYTLFLTPTQTVLSLRPGREEGRSVGNSGSSVAAVRDRRPQGSSLETDVTPAVLRMTLLGANPGPQVEGLDALPSTVNYFVGNDPHQWRSAIPTFGKVKYHQVYPGVDLVYYGNQRQVEYDFLVSAHADPKRIALGFSGADRLEIDSFGDLVARLPGGTVRWHKPFAYQDTPAGRREIAAGFVMKKRQQVGFEIAAYDVGRPLIIDPQLVYSTYLGGGGSDYIGGIAVDGSGSVYVVGDTTSLNFPTNTPYQSASAGLRDVFVTKLDPSGSSLVYSTYLGGSSNEFAGGIALDSSGNAYLTGQTDSPNFPLKNAVQAVNNGFSDAFVAKLGPLGTNLVYSTYLGGNGDDGGNAIAADNSGNAYVTGVTYSRGVGISPFPTTHGAFQADNGGGVGGGSDAFVTKFDTNGALVYSTFLGGHSSEAGNGIALDSSGNACVAGVVEDTTSFPPALPSSDFPILNAFQPNFNPGITDPFAAGTKDGFVTKLNATGTALIFSTFLGGGFDDSAHAIAVDAANRVYVVGETYSTNFPILNAAQPILGGLSPENSLPPADAFVTVLDTNGASLRYSTYLGGSGFESGFDSYRFGMGIDQFGYIYLAGWTDSPGAPDPNDPSVVPFPISPGADQTNSMGLVGDAFSAKINPAVPGSNSLVYATFLSGTSDNRATAVAVDSSGNFYVAGFTSSTDFPVANALEATYNGGSYDGFIAKFSSPPDLSVAMTPSTNPVVVGSNLTFAIQVNNNGRSTFSGVTNFVQLATNFQVLSVSTSLGSSSTNGGLVTFSMGTLTNNATVQQTIVVATLSATITTNTANLTSIETPILEPNTANNLATVVSAIVGVADVTLNQSAAPDPGLVGSNLTYTINLVNKGPSSVSSLTVTDVLSPLVSLVSATNTQGTSFTFDGVATVTCTLTNLAKNATATVSITVNPTATGSATNIANAAPFEFDPNPANNTASVVSAINALADLTLSQTGSANPVLAGNNLIYTLRITNLGPSTASNVVLTDPLPPGAAFVSATNSQGACSQSSGVVTCNLGSLATNATATVGITVRPNNAGTITNTASVTSAASDPASANNSASVITTVNAAAGGIPSLNIVLAGTNAILSWTTNALGFNLQSRPSLSTDSAWTDVTTNPPATVGNQFTVTNALTATNRFYRLLK